MIDCLSVFPEVNLPRKQGNSQPPLSNRSLSIISTASSGGRVGTGVGLIVGGRVAVVGIAEGEAVAVGIGVWVVETLQLIRRKVKMRISQPFDLR